MGTIVVSNLGKAYKQYPNRWSRLLEWITPGKTKRHELKWVLQDLNFTVSAGQAVGIIGINGAGKSTLLKLITGTTQPTTGSVHMTGRVAALLELGMGFHPDFTGRQNAFMAGQLLGISSKEIARLMPEIEAFAEIDDYIDQPVRMYSSGMQMRLAFSVATAIRPDILIVDEALSVGDTYFQHKSFERIREFRKQGTTLLIVSHDKGAIQSICDCAILLSAGHLVMQGEPEAVMDYYNAMLANHQNQVVKQVVLGDGKARTQSGDGSATVNKISLIAESGKAIDLVDVGQIVTLNIEIICKKKLDKLVIGILLKDRLGQPVFGVTTESLNKSIKDVNSENLIVCNLKLAMNLGAGSYSVATALTDSKTHLAKNYEWRDRALIFSVANLSKEEFIGVNYLPIECDIFIATQ